MSTAPTPKDRALALQIGLWLLEHELERHEADHCARLIAAHTEEAARALRERIQLDRELFGAIHTSLLAAGWKDDELIRRVKAAQAPNGHGQPHPTERDKTL